MEGLRATQIVHRIEEGNLSIYYGEFVKWMGFFLLDVTFDEEHMDRNIRMDFVKNQFDFIIYLNDESGEMYEWYHSHSDMNIDIYYKKDNWNPQQFGEEFLKLIWEKVFGSGQEKELLKIQTIVNELIDIYKKRNVFPLLLDDRNILVSKNWKEELEERYDRWNDIIGDLEDCCKRYSELQGREYLIYALVNSYRRANDLCRILGIREAIDVGRLLDLSYFIYDADFHFFNTEYLRAQITQNDFMRNGFAIHYMRNCIELCNIRVIESFLYYHLGKIYEKEDEYTLALRSYEESYRRDTKNFRAIYKLAIEQKYQGNYEKERSYLVEILQILQAEDDEKLKYLDPIRLEYVYKCYVLMGELEYERSNNPVSGGPYYNKANIISDKKQLKQNKILKTTYSYLEDSDMEKIYKSLEEKLSVGYIRDKIVRWKNTDEYIN